jgi:Effector Associated Constant Component 1
MDLRITIAGHDQQIRQIGDLYRWLIADSDVAAAADISLVSQASPSGHMGAVTDAINLVLTQAESLASVALAYATWRQSRHDAPPVTFQSSNVTISVTDGSQPSIQRLIQALQGGPSSHEETASQAADVP